MNIPPFRLYGLLDCNSFFASCEKLFRPDLKNKAVVVLSNNDGDRINRLFGTGTLKFGSQGTADPPWRGASEHSSPNYTLRFGDLPIVKAK